MMTINGYYPPVMAFFSFLMEKTAFLLGSIEGRQQEPVIIPQPGNGILRVSGGKNVSLA
jgi:hypothetical protein